MASVLVDTGVWYALSDPTDRIASEEVVDALQARIEVHTVVVPWPIAYETLRTSFVRKRLALERFEQTLKSPRVILIDDSPYRDHALALSIGSSLRGRRPLSMVDCLMRILLDDINVKIRYLATFNARDFVDVCTRRRIELWSQ
jgi:predicted nucleic acid-binding protein